jgi:phosphatidylethanolamine-binding protein (PEBP) family uncharacterized protein
VTLDVGCAPSLGNYCGLVRILVAVLAYALLTACGGGEEVATKAPDSIQVTSSAFGPDEPIPASYACTGRDAPSGTHHYRFAVYALDAPLEQKNGADTDDTLAAIGRHAVAQGRLVGLFAAD